jgi:hypothetical protein
LASGRLQRRDGPLIWHGRGRPTVTEGRWMAELTHLREVTREEDLNRPVGDQA